MALCALTKTLACVSFFFMSVCLGKGPFHDWFRSRVSLPTEVYGGFAVFSTEYSHTSYADCIFIFGGVGCTTCFWCYNPTVDFLYTWPPSLVVGASNLADPSAVVGFEPGTNDPSIYYLTSTGEIRKINLETLVQSSVVNVVGAGGACLVRNRDGTELYIVDGGLGTDFWIYDVVNDNLVQGPGREITQNRLYPSCAINNWQGSAYGDPEDILYVAGGGRNTIDRIPVRGLLEDVQSNGLKYKWRTVSIEISAGMTRVSIVSYQNYLYFIGGLIGSSATDTFGFIDVETWEYQDAGDFLGSRASITSVIAYDRIYSFGGITSNNPSDAITFTNIADYVPDATACSGGDLLLLDTNTGLFECRAPRVCPNENDPIIKPCTDDPHCETCESWGCKKCETGYYRIAGSFRGCVSCAENYQNCQKCQSWKGCTLCDIGYSLQDDPFCERQTCQPLNS